MRFHLIAVTEVAPVIVLALREQGLDRGLQSRMIFAIQSEKAEGL